MKIGLRRRFRKNFFLRSESLPSNLIRLQSVPLTVVAQTYGHPKRQIKGDIEQSNESPSALTSFYPYKINYKQNLYQEFPHAKSEFSIIIRSNIGFTYNPFKSFTRLYLLEPLSFSSQAVAGSLSKERIMFYPPASSMKRGAS